ncbi:MAG: GTP-binding protein [Candidatus Micrarchaeota archaeon]|nr:GTP-binding protein [Candidatus Micrarchaeota archaeon]
MTGITTGIEKLDRLLSGRLEKNRKILFFSSPGIDVPAFAQQVLFSSLENGDSGIYAVFNKPPESVREGMKEYMWDVEKFEEEGKLLFLDGFSKVMKSEASEKFSCDPRNFEEVKGSFENALAELSGKKTVVVDEISNLIDLLGEEKVLELVKMINSESSVVCIFTNWLYPEELVEKLRKSFDEVVEFKSIEEKVILRNYLYIEGKAIPFKIAKPGGINIYVPKILVTGPYHAGKTTIVKQLSDRSVSVNRFGTTIALDHGYIEHGGFSCELFGTPGQERFDFILSILAKDVFGVILVVDSTLPESFPRAKNMLSKVKGYGIPYVVVANKQDLPEALSVDEIRKLLGVPDEVPVIPAVATQNKGLREALETLFKLILKGGEHGKERSS